METIWLLHDEKASKAMIIRERRSKGTARCPEMKKSTIRKYSRCKKLCKAKISREKSAPCAQVRGNCSLCPGFSSSHLGTSDCKSPNYLWTLWNLLLNCCDIFRLFSCTGVFVPLYLKYQLYTSKHAADAQSAVDEFDDLKTDDPWESDLLKFKNFRDLIFGLKMSGNIII